MLAPFAGNALKSSGPLGAGYVSLRHDCRVLALLCWKVELHFHCFASLCKLSVDSACSLVHASRALHTSPQSLAPVPPLPEKGGKVRHGIFPEELFQLLYPKTGVTGQQLEI